MDKVVKLDSVATGVTFQEDSTILGSDYPLSPHELKQGRIHPFSSRQGTSQSESQYTMGGPILTFGEGVDSNDDIDNSPSEAGDILYPLPDGWPKLPEIFVRRSWDFSTATSPVVNKATAHLELLQNIIEDWSLQTRNDILSRASSRTAMGSRSRATSAASSHAASRRQMKFTPSALSSLGVGSRQPSAVARSITSASQHSATTQLSIQGVGAQIDTNMEINTEKPAMPFTEFEIPYLGAEDVIDEVVTLLAKLENNRRETKQNLKQEQERVDMLSNKIDSLSEHRLKALPDAVQTEHEACAMDINELNWHVSYRSRVEARILNKANVAEVLNSKLKEDIAYVKKHCPLVQEKLELEKEAMDRIKQAQSDTNEELGQTTERCDKVSYKSVEAHSKADQERHLIKDDLDNVRQDLNSISEELAEAKMTHNTYVHMCNDYREQLKENEQELRILQVKNDNAKSAEAMQAAKVRDLQGKIVEQELEHKKLEDENFNFKSRLENQRINNATVEQEMKLAVMKSEDKLRKLTRANEELVMDIEDHQDKIKDCEKQKKADEKNLIRMAKELERTNENMKITEEDLHKVRTVNRAVKDKLHTVEDKALMEEEGLKARAEALRKQVKEEIHSKTVIQARIQADSSDLVKDEAETKTKKEKVSQKVEEVELVVKSVLDKVLVLRTTHEERTKVLEALTDDIQKLERERTSLLESVATKMSTLEPNHKQITADLLGLDKRIDHMDWKTEMMNKNLEEMDNSGKMMTRSMAKTQVTIDKLQDEMDHLTIKITAGQHMLNQLKNTLSQVSGRVSDNEKQHKQLMQERQKVLLQNKEALGTNLKLNKELAATYRRLQHQYIALKNDMLNHLDGRVQAETSVKDLKKVQGLQKRLHAALNVYYKLRGMYHKLELERMEAESVENSRKVGELKDEIDSSLSGISKFITSQMDGSVARQMPLDKGNGAVDTSQILLDMKSTSKQPPKTTTISAVS